MRPLVIAAVLVPLAACFVLADDAGSSRTHPAGKADRAEKKGTATVVAPEREEAALAFVREHYPELTSLLESLRVMKPAEYSRAIGELYQVSRSLESLKPRNPRRYEVGLELWKAKSRAELLAARLVSTPSTDLESQLRNALESQLDLEIRQQQLEQEQLRTRLEQVDATIKRLNDNRDKLIDTRLQGLRNKVQRARRQNGGKPAPSRPARVKGESKA